VLPQVFMNETRDLGAGATSLVVRSHHSASRKRSTSNAQRRIQRDRAVAKEDMQRSEVGGQLWRIGGRKNRPPPIRRKPPVFVSQNKLRHLCNVRFKHLRDRRGCKVQRAG
jgi:hypothetical protein